MQQDFASRLLLALSSERLGAYRDRLDDSGDANLFAHYAWNMALSESLYPSLQVLEVALRNTIHAAASQQFQRADWYEDARVVNWRDLEAVSKAKKGLESSKKPLEPGRIVAELTFGFWTAMLDRRYEQVLWPTLLKPCFPYMPRSLRTRKNISARFQRIRALRNRVFHHEPIWHWRDLGQQHSDILEAIAWIEPAARNLIEAIDNFPSVHRNGLTEIESRLQRFF